jgi:hypothetical protein
MSVETLDPGEWGPFEELAAAAAEILRLRSLLKFRGLDPDDPAYVPEGHLVYHPQRADDERGRAHRTVPIEHDGVAAEIDMAIAPLVLEVWRAGLRTVNSCQDNPSGFVWLEFESLGDATRFLDIAVQPAGAVPDDLHDLYHRAFREGPGAFWPLSRRLWLYKVLPRNTGQPDLVQADFLLSVRFPQTDLPAVLERLRAHNGPEAGD